MDATVYDIDLFENDASVVATLHSQGKKAICYVSVGSWEPYRPDAGSFPETVKGRAIDGFADEKWLDIRRIDVLGPIMQARFDLCKQKGFDAVEPDNVDGFTNKTGFPLTATDQLTYNRYIAAAAHNRGLSVGLKNDVDQLKDLVGNFDWALNEQCFEYKECDGYAAFVSAGKAVFQVEYTLKPDQFCPAANSMGFNSMQKDVNLDGFRVPCRTVTVATLSIAAIVNGASYAAGGVSPNEIVALFGTAMSVTGSAGTRVLFDGAPAQVLYASPTQITAIVPPGVQGQSTTRVTVDPGNGQVSPVISVPVVAAVPALFTLNAQGAAAVVNQDGTINSLSNPAARGSYVSLWGTGFAGTDVTVRIGGQSVAVTYVGLIQINAIIPTAIAGGPRVPVVVQSAGVSSPDGVTMAIAQ